MSKSLELKNIAKSFGSIKVLQDVNLSLLKGERHALIGPNGAGKTTLFNMISGEFNPSAGEVWLNGRQIVGVSNSRLNRLGLSRSFQITSLFDGLSVHENLEIALMGRFNKRWALTRRGREYEHIKLEIDNLLEMVRLEEYASKLARELPYSDQRALEIGMTIATDPAVVLLDEPTAGMSREETAYIMNLIKMMTIGRTLLLVEHDMEVVFGLADRISVLVYGKIIATDTPENIRTNKKVQEAYLGVVALEC